MKKKLYIGIIGILIVGITVSSFGIYYISTLIPKKIGIGSNQDSVDYLIITADSLVSYVEPLAIWKQQKGLTTAIVTVEEITQNFDGEDDQDSIRNCINSFHEEKDTSWVLLAGNKEYVPTRLIKFNNNFYVCDHYYANLDDNWNLNPDNYALLKDPLDWDLDVNLGRLPAENAEELELLVTRLLNYEKNPPVGSWMSHAVFGGAFAHFTYDLNGNSILDDEDVIEFDANRVMNWVTANILPSKWSSTILAEVEGITPSKYYCDIALNEVNIQNVLSSGASVTLLDSHGLTTGMARMFFNVDQDGDKMFDVEEDLARTIIYIDTHSEIDSNGKNGLFFLSACETGNFDYSGMSLSEYILQTCGIGCIASSRSANYDAEWYEREHGGWMAQGLYTRFFTQFFNNGVNQPGKAFSLAKGDFVEDYVNLNGLDDNKNIQGLVQFNLLGDPEVPIWTSIPSQLNPIISSNESGIHIKVTSDSQPIENVVITLMNSTYYWEGFTDENGKLSFELSMTELNDLTLTLSKNGYLCYQQLASNPLDNFPDYS